MKKIVIACVNYHNYKEVMNYINHIHLQSLDKYLDIVVTDNSDDLEEFHQLKVSCLNHKNVYLYNAHANLGYLNGLNYGLKHYSKDHEMPEWIVLSNTDLTYENDGFYEDLITLYPEGYNCAIAPCIYSSTNRIFQNPLLLNRCHKLKIKILMYVYKYPLIEYLFNIVNNFKNKFLKHKISLIENQTIYSGHGSCLILNKRYFLNGGDLNFGSFLFGEEIYIAEMVKYIGGSIYFDNRLKVIHHEHQTTGKQKKKLINKFYYESMNYLYKTFYD